MQSGSVQDCMSRLKSYGYLIDVPLECTPDQAEEELLLHGTEEVTLLRWPYPRDAWLFLLMQIFIS